MSTDVKATQNRIINILKEWKDSGTRTADQFTLPICRGKDVIGRLRPLTRESIDDSEAIRLLAEFREKAASFFPSQFKVSLESTKNWCDRVLYQVEDRILFWVETAEGDRIGHVGLYRFDWENGACEVDNIIRGRDGKIPGLMTDAIRTMLEWSFDVLGLRLNYLRVVSDNPKALALYERLGYEEVQRVPLKRTEKEEAVIWEEIRDEPYLEIERYFVTMRLPKERLVEKATKRKMISIVLPAYNEEGNIARCHDEITPVMESLNYDYEVLLIDNNSEDRTGELAIELCRKDPRWKYIKFSRNFTSEASMAAGTRYAQGDAVVYLFSDLQEPPEVIPKFVEKWEQGYDVVYGVHTLRPDDSWSMRIGVHIYYKLLNYLSDENLPEHAGDFRLIDRKAVDVLNKMKEKNRYLRGLSHWVGYRSCPVEYQRRPRLAGESKAPGLYMVLFAIRTLINFSIRPLQMFMGLGFVLLGITMFMILLLVGNRILAATVGYEIAEGLTTTHILLLLNLGVMCSGFGVLGEYIGHTYTEAKRRPLWVVETTENMSLSDEEKLGI